MLEAQEQKAKYNRHFDLIESSFSYITFGKRCCELSKEEKKEFNRLQKMIQRKNKKAGIVNVKK